MPWSAIVSALSRASATVSGVPGHSGARVSYPAASKNSRHGVQEVECSQSPWMNMTVGMARLRIFSDAPILAGAVRGPLRSTDSSRGYRSGQLGTRRDTELGEDPVQVAA